MANKRSGGGLSATQQAAKFLGVSVLAGAVMAGLALPAAGIMGLAAKETAEGFEELPIDLKRPPLSQKTQILDAEGGLIADVYSRNRVVVPLDAVSPWMRKAIVAIEDARFYEHGAVDPKGVLRALNRNAQEGEITQGASTLTQQYVKNVFVEEAGNEEEAFEYATRQTYGRKIMELKYAIALEQELTKDQILENYLNITYFSQQAYGVEAAAQRYFSKSAKDLQLHEAAVLAGIVQSPYAYDPVERPESATKRRNIVLDRMADVGDITEQQAEAAQKKPLGLKVNSAREGCITATMKAGFFCDYVEKAFLANPAFGKTDKERRARWDHGGLTIRTTLSPQAQQAATDAAVSKVNEDDKVAAAVVSVEPGTGRITAMAQSRPYGTVADEHQTMINLSVDSPMGGSTYGFQVGSTFKPIVAAAALEKGVSPAETFTSDHTHTFQEKDFLTCDGTPYGDKPYEVPNELKSETGTWDMTSALGKSINTYSVDLLSKTGLCATAKMAKDMGVRLGTGKPLKVVPSMALGSLESSPLTMAAAYATFGARGVYCEPMAIESVTDAEGKKLKPAGPNCERAMSEKTADTVNQILEGVVEDGTGTSAGLSDRPNAGKTGTTDGRKQAWFVGYTPDLSTAVWVGGDGSVQPKMFDITIGGTYYAKVCGGCLPGPIWREAMTGALQGVEGTPFNEVDVPRGRDEEGEGDGDGGDSDGGGDSGDGGGNGGDRDDGRPGGDRPAGRPEFPGFDWNPAAGGASDGGNEAGGPGGGPSGPGDWFGDGGGTDGPGGEPGFPPPAG
ncbi:transglycosylase domain-containing protein [Streptomyces sp. TRM 70351]|uniref:transglycosylase domain-containing protein n=1 Tax=Streptomyces sp. TRM 70351 TaxID=3116552 RepID=UPI002E7BA603|nr:transglycosylase domain-containing protein [Streptomyces sp. TRM 70351]MEE1930230.1 transglycosylase domain-containing protein [Streptomyces sp. TRM 70351]